MKRRLSSFNIYFALVCLVLAAGCASDKQTDERKSHKKEQSTIRLYLEGQKADRTTAGTVMVTRNKYLYTVEREPFLNEADLVGASIVDDPSGDGSYSIQLTFNDHASMLLDMDTASNKGKHIIVFSQFPGRASIPRRKRRNLPIQMMRIWWSRTVSHRRPPGRGNPPGCRRF